MPESSRPILVLQMQRIGDLILSFPLFLWLARTFPGRPIKVVAEQSFYKDLLPLSPEVVYVPWAGTESLKKTKYELIINLSIRPEAARLAGELDADAKIGPEQRPGGAMYIHGDWQLYRASLVNNNRCNRFHWADLNALDVIPLTSIRATRFDPPGQTEATGNKVGIFLGASEPAKRPGNGFWRGLLNELLKRGMEPVLFGGPMERESAAQVLKDFGGPVHNTCGMLNLGEVAALGRTLRLFITPDTGPMHLMAWTGTRVLNLSLGNVNPWETGPYPPGHHILRSSASCTGCWSCTKEDFVCHHGYSPARIASLAKRIMRDNDNGGRAGGQACGMKAPGLDLVLSARDEDGLYHLAPDSPYQNGVTARDLLSEFWTDFWGARFGLWPESRPRASWTSLREALPRLGNHFRARLPLLGRTMSRRLAHGGIPENEFWKSAPPLLRPLTGYAHMLLQNTDFRTEGWKQSLELIEQLIAAVRD